MTKKRAASSRALTPRRAAGAAVLAAALALGLCAKRRAPEPAAAGVAADEAPSQPGAPGADFVYRLDFSGRGGEPKPVFTLDGKELGTVMRWESPRAGPRVGTARLKIPDARRRHVLVVRNPAGNGKEFTSTFEYDPARAVWTERHEFKP